MSPDGNPWEAEIEAVADALYRDWEALPEVKIPFGQVKLTREEQVERYMTMRDDPDAWAGIVQEQGPQEAIKYARTMEKLLEGGDARSTTEP